MSEEIMSLDWLFRRAAWKGDFDLIKELDTKGADINYYEPDQVHPYGDTPLMLAAAAGHQAIVHYLLDRGADVTYHNKMGNYASLYAKTEGHFEIANLIKEKEPKEFHDSDYKMNELIESGIPKNVLETLGTDNVRLNFNGNNCNYLVLRTIFEVSRFKVYGYEVFDLLFDLDSFEATGMITWCPSLKQFMSIDEEHDSIINLNDMTWDAFLEDPGYFLDRILDGFYDSEEID